MKIRCSEIGALVIFYFSQICITINTYAQITFTPHTITTNADGAYSVYAIDLDSDNDIDVISASTKDNKIAWYENDGIQNFIEHTISTNADDAQDVYAIDMDGDNDIDVLSASWRDDKIAWYENDGNQNFAEHILTTNAWGPSAIYAIDLDRDSDMDVLYATTRIYNVDWLENDGNQNFTRHLVSKLGGEVRSVYAVDMDNDGDIDVLSTSSNDKKVLWHQNDGNQNFTTHTITTDISQPHSVVAIDIDKDDDIDVLSAFLGNKIAWFENDGSQNFTEHAISTSLSSPSSIYSIDLDNDNDHDVISASWWDDKIAWYKNDGNQNFVEHTIATNADGARAVFAIDLDGDRDIDVLSASQHDDKIAWYEQESDRNCSSGYAPSKNGFSVQNGRTTRDWEMFLKLYGQETVGSSPINALSFYVNVYSTECASTGSCVGLSAASLLAYFPAIDQSYVSPYDIDHINALHNITTQSDRIAQLPNNLPNSISYYHGVCTTREFSELPWLEPLAALDQIKNNLCGDKPIVLGVINPDPSNGGAHAIAPYEVVTNPNDPDEVWVKVYDPNFPHVYDPAIPDRFLVNNRKVVFNLQEDTWQFELFPGVQWEGTSDVQASCFIKIVDLDLFVGRCTPTWNQDETTFISASGNASLLFVDQKGKRFGYDEGRLVNEIPLATPQFKWGVSDTAVSPVIGYILPIEATYTTYLEANSDGLTDCRIFGKGYVIEFERIQLDTFSHDQFGFSQDGKFCSYSTNDSSKQFSATMSRELIDKGRIFTISNMPISKGDSTKLSIIDNNSFKYSNIGSPKTYDLKFVQTGEDSGAMSVANIAIGGNESHLIIPADWNSLHTTHAVLQIDKGNDGRIDSSTIIGTITPIDDTLFEYSLENFILSQNYPNPFNSQTTIQYEVPINCHVTLKIYNSMGQEILTLVDKHKTAGQYSTNWDGRDLQNREVSSGIYFYKMEVVQYEISQLIKVKKMFYLK